MKIPVFAALLALLACPPAFAAPSPELPRGIIETGPRPAPALQLNNMEGEAFDLASTRGHWVFVHFWASWCGPCRREMPTIARMASLLGDQGPQIVLVNTSETEDTVFTFLGLLAPEFSPLLDLDGSVTERWQPRGLPSTFLVDPDGQIRYVVLGGRDWSQPAYLDFLRGLRHNALK